MDWREIALRKIINVAIEEYCYFMHLSDKLSDAGISFDSTLGEAFEQTYNIFSQMIDSDSLAEIMHHQRYSTEPIEVLVEWMYQEIQNKFSKTCVEELPNK